MQQVDPWYELLAVIVGFQDYWVGMVCTRCHTHDLLLGPQFSTGREKVSNLFTLHTQWHFYNSQEFRINSEAAAGFVKLLCTFRTATPAQTYIAILTNYNGISKKCFFSSVYDIICYLGHIGIRGLCPAVMWLVVVIVTLETRCQTVTVYFTHHIRSFSHLLEQTDDI